MYFTSDLEYAGLYSAIYSSKNTDNLSYFIMALIAPGNPFPVIEHPLEINSYKAMPCRTGYQSHFTLGNQAIQMNKRVKEKKK